MTGEDFAFGRAGARAGAAWRATGGFDVLRPWLGQGRRILRFASWRPLGKKAPEGDIALSTKGGDRLRGKPAQRQGS